jgi:hypothetical protein
LVCKVCLEDMGAELEGLKVYPGRCEACGALGTCYSVVEALEAARDKLDRGYSRLLAKFRVK